MRAAGDTWERPSQGMLDRVHRLLCWQFALYALAAGSLAAAGWSPLAWAVQGRASGGTGLLIAACLIACSGLAACVMVNGARRATGPMSAGRIRPGGTGRFAQGVVVPALAMLAGLAAWGLRAVPDAALDPATATSLGGLTILLAFPALIAERFVAAIPPTALPEAASLRRLLGVPVAVFVLGGGLLILRGQGLLWAAVAVTMLAAVLALLAAELAVRGLLRWFQPPTDPMQTRARVDSLLAGMPGWARKGGVAEPLRAHFGLDFSRSWALGFLRRALAPAAMLTGLACWGLSGVVLLPVDSRGVYERFGAPVAVVGPGLHVVLPWPFGRIRPVEFGVVHSIPLGAAVVTVFSNPPPAEGPAPAEADRLWDQPHPAEADWLIAGSGTSGQSFQVMSADIRVLYRTGLADADALNALYNVAEPDLLVREVADRTVTRFFAGRTLDSVLDERRERMADELQAALARALQQDRSGLEIVSVTIEAVHPPAGAAVAYHNVQAAEIIARTAIATETGRAHGIASLAREQSWDILDKSRALAAETVSAADGDGRSFAGDRAARTAGGQAFLLERYFQTVSAALSRAPLTVVDHRVAPGMAPVIDLRPYAAAARATGEDPD